MKFPTLYKLDNKGRIRSWYMVQDGDTFHSVSGLVDSENATVSKPTTAEPTNVGRKNERNAVQQAEFMILAKYTKKAKEGFVDSIESLEQPLPFIKPMLARHYYHKKPNGQVEDNRPSQDDFKRGVYVQPKLDGVRCLATKDRLQFRSGDTIVSCPHISKSLELIFDSYPTLVLDGELYNHELKDDFNQIVSLVRTSKVTKESLDQTARLVQFHVYDSFFTDNNQPFRERDEFLYNLSLQFESPIVRVETFKVLNLATIDECLNEAIEEGYEGLMVRKGQSMYKHTKCKDLLKFKLFMDAEFKILDILEGKGSNAGMASKIKIQVGDKIVYPNMTGTHDYCRQVLKDKADYIGSDATVSFMGYTEDGSLRFPRAITLHKGKRDY